MTNLPKTVFIVSHTHWDREWYKPFHQFRVDLARIIKRILRAVESEPDFRHFLLDGQAIVLEDYLDIHPEDEDRIIGLVESDGLSVGPWYILPDEFLVSAESTARNLLIGHRVSNRVGGVQKVGYMPDSFGHIAQMPQILRSAGIDSFVYSRGNGDEIEETGYEFWWLAPDGSEVLAVNQCKGYDNAAGLGLASYWEAHTQRDVDVDLAVERIRELFAEMAGLSQGDVYLLNNGGDHIGPQRKFGEIVKALEAAFPNTRFFHGSLQQYLDAVRDAKFVKNSFAGELLSGRFHFILSGVWSARMYLKQLNDMAQTMLSLCAEPMAAYERFCHGVDYPGGSLDDSWKLLLENHPHDSICGCSTDEVHREMVPRFEGVIQTAEQLLRHLSIRLAPTFARNEKDDKDTVICVANPLPAERREVVERLVVLQNHGPDTSGLVLRDGSGTVVPFEVVDKKFVRRFWGVDYRTELSAERQAEMLNTYLSEFGDGYLVENPSDEDHDCFLTIQFVAGSVPAVGHSQFFLREEPVSESPADSSRNAFAEHSRVKVEGNTVENDSCMVTLYPNGTFDVLDKTTGIGYPGLNRLEDAEDVGDEYDYSPSKESLTITSESVDGNVRVIEDTGYRGGLEAEFNLALPESIDGDRRTRSDRTVECRSRVRVTLESGSPLIAVELLFDNCAKDHRLRAEFPTQIATESVLSDGHFYVNHRTIDQPYGEGWKQNPAGTYPQQEFSLVQNGERGLAVLNQGLPEIEAKQGPDVTATLYLTLLRSVGWLSRDDFDTRSCSNAGPTVHTPDAQCIGEAVYRYAVVPFGGDFLEADIKGLSQRYRVPLLTVQGVADGAVEGGTGLVRHQSKYVAISAIKRHEERETLILRAYNLRGEKSEDRFVFGPVAAGAWNSNLLEERHEKLELDSSNSLDLEFGPHQIRTVEVAFAQ